MSVAEAISKFLRMERLVYITQPPEIKEVIRLVKNMEQVMARGNLPADVKEQM